jgi:hypothetical protein
LTEGVSSEGEVVDEVDPEKVKPLPVWFLVAFTLVWAGVLAGPELAWDGLEPWSFAGLFVGLFVLLVLLLLEFRRRCGLPFRRIRVRRTTDWPLTVSVAITPGLVIFSSKFLLPPVFIGLALAAGVLVATHLQRVNEGIRAEVAAGR